MHGNMPFCTIFQYIDTMVMSGEILHDYSDYITILK